MTGRRHAGGRVAQAALMVCLITVIALVVLVGLAGTQSLASAVPASGYAVGAGSPEQRYSSCLKGSGHGDLLLLIDESSSISSTDPTDARVTAARYLIDQLARTTAATGIRLSVSIAAFADTYRQVLGWTTLGQGSVGSIDAAVATLRHANNGFDTDYWTALDSARRSLESRAGSDRATCQAMVWFTDGALDIEPRSGQGQMLTKPYTGGLKLTDRAAAAKAFEVAKTDLCRTGGVADGLRTDGIITFAIGLRGPSGPAPDFSLMKRIATGRSGSETCGKVLVPTPGSFRLVSSIDNLLFAFDSIAEPGSGTTTRTGICQASATDPACVRDRHTFVLDGSIKTVHILGTSTISNAQVVLRTPGGATVALTDHGVGSLTSVSAGAVQIRYTWASQKTLSIDMTQPASGASWTGEWALIFADPTGSSPRGTSISDIHISSDIALAWPGASSATLRSGTTVHGVHLELVRGNGQPVAATSILGTIKVSASLVDADGTMIRPVASNLTNATLAKPLDLDLTGVDPGSAGLRLDLTITTHSIVVNGRTVPGTPLTADVTTVPLTVAAPLNYPSIGRRLDFGSVTGPAHQSAQVVVTGSGCVWLDPNVTSTAFPDTVGTIHVSSKHESQSTCEKVHGSTSLDAELTTAHEGLGDLKGTAKVWSVPGNGSGKPVPLPVEYSLSMQPSLKVWHFATALLIALILGPGIPLLLLYLAKWIEARIPAGTLLAQRFPIVATPDGAIRDGLPLSLRDRDFVDHPVVVTGRGLRRVDVLGVALHAVITRAPGKPCEVAAEHGGGISASSHRPQPYDHKLRARLPLAVRNHWVLLHDPSGPSEAAELLVIVSPDSPTTSRAELFEEAAQRIPGLLATLRADARERGTPVADDRPRQQQGAFRDAGGPSAFAGPGADFGSGSFPDGADSFPGGPGNFPGGPETRSKAAPGTPPPPASRTVPDGHRRPDASAPVSSANPAPENSAPENATPNNGTRQAPFEDDQFGWGTGFPEGGSFPDAATPPGEGTP